MIVAVANSARPKFLHIRWIETAAPMVPPFGELASKIPRVKFAGRGSISCGRERGNNSFTPGNTEKFPPDAYFARDWLSRLMNKR